MGSGLRHPVLRDFLAYDELGVWSLCPRTINFLESQIHAHRPSGILEFGSGISTICLAAFMRDIHGDSDRAYICSVEQDLPVIESTRQRLSILRLDRFVRFASAPLIRQRIMDREIDCYAISDGDINEIRALHPDFVVVDGPASDAGARFGTLPLVLEAIAPGARIFLDDAFRDGELDTAKSWKRLIDMQFEGVLPTKKGLLLGRLGSTSH